MTPKQVELERQVQLYQARCTNRQAAATGSVVHGVYSSSVNKEEGAADVMELPATHSLKLSIADFATTHNTLDAGPEATHGKERAEVPFEHAVHVDLRHGQLHHMRCFLLHVHRAAVV